MASRSWTITKDEDRLNNVHPGDVLREDFLIGSEIPLVEVATGTGIDPQQLELVVASKLDVDADTDIRLARYFGMSEGFFLRLQIDYDLEEAHRAHGDELSRITKRAA